MRERSKKPLSLTEFRSIYSKVNRLNVELIITSEKGILLTLRSIEPYLNEWHVPGGTVYYRERLVEAVKRIAWEEIGVEVDVIKQVGFIEYPSIAKYGKIDSPVGIGFECKLLDTNFKLDDQSSSIQFFKELPQNMIKEQKEFVLSGSYLK